MPLAIFFAAAVFGAQLTPAQDCTPGWDPTFTAGQLGGPVMDAVWHDDGDGPAIYALGAFDRVSGVYHSGVARFRDGRWKAVGRSFSPIYGRLFSYDAGDGPDLWVFASGSYISNALVLRGRVYEDRSAGFEIGEVWAGASFDDGTGPALYVIGLPRSGTRPPLVCRYRRSGWERVPGTLSVDPNSPAFSYSGAMAVYDDGRGPALYVAGGFSHIDGRPMHGIARWDGRSWSDLGPTVGLDCCRGAIRDMAVVPTPDGPELLICGRFFDINGVIAKGIASWNGHRWLPWNSQGVSYQDFASICVLPHDGATDIIIGGREIERRTLNSVQLVDPDVDGLTAKLLTGVASGDGELLCFGAFTQIGDRSVPFAGKIHNGDAEPLGPVGNGLPTSSGGLSVYPLFAPGDGTVLISNTAIWDGTSTRRTRSTEAPRGQVIGYFKMNDGTGNALYGLGTFPLPAGGTASLCRKVGSAWVPIPVQDGSSSAISSGVAFAVADFGEGEAIYIGGGGNTSHVNRWNGHSWSQVGDLTGSVRSLALGNLGSGPRLFAAGYALRTDDGAYGALFQFDGRAWTPAVAPLDRPSDPAGKLIVFDDGNGAKLYVAGQFQTPAGLHVSLMARHDGARWEDISNPSTMYATRIEGFTTLDLGARQELYIFGFIATSGASLLSRWTGAEWENVPPSSSQYDEWATSAVGFRDASGPGIMLTGSFRQPGGIPADRLALWRPCDVACIGDFDHDGGTTGADIQAFFDSWQSGSPLADTNADGGVDGADVEQFVVHWQEGC